MKMRQNIRFNLNDYVSFQNTPEARARLRDFYMKQDVSPWAKTSPFDESYLIMQGWEFARAFGPVLGAHLDNPFDMNIFIHPTY